MNSKPTAEEIAHDLAAFLTRPVNSYGGKSPMAERMERAIGQMADAVVKEVIDAAPELRKRINAMAHTAIKTALADDKLLRTIVADSVGRGLAQLISDRQDERNSDD